MWHCLVLIWIGLFGSLQELEEMKKRLKEMEEEAAALRDMQAKVEKEMSAVQGEQRCMISCLMN